MTVPLYAHKDSEHAGSQWLPNSACVGPSKSQLQKPLLVLGECVRCGLPVLCSGCDFRRSVCWVSKHTGKS